MIESFPRWGLLFTLPHESGDYPSESVCGVVDSRTTPPVAFLSLEFCGGRWECRVAPVVSVLRLVRISSYTYSILLGAAPCMLRAAKLSTTIVGV